MDTKFSVALHSLTMIAESEAPLSSQALANSVGTNPSYIRKVISLLKNAGLISSSQGKIGYELTREVTEISLLEIYFAVHEVDAVSPFQIHKHSNQECPVGMHIERALNPVFKGVEDSLAQQLESHSLEDIIKNLYAQAGKTRQ